MGHSRKNGTLRDYAPARNPNVSRHRIDSYEYGGGSPVLGDFEVDILTGKAGRSIGRMTTCSLGRENRL